MNPSQDLQQRVAGLDGPAIEAALDSEGYAALPPLLTPTECGELAGLYDQTELFRSRIEMARYNFGRGEYKYFDYPLPAPVEELRQAFYLRLVSTANRWMERLGLDPAYPADLADFLARCHEHGQTRSTPLILRYEAGGYNALHQDLYGEIAFPFQVVFLLSQPSQDFTGGELLLVEQRPRAQSRGTSITLEQGAALIFPNNYRPVKGTRGYYRTTVRHGVSHLKSGRRFSLGLIFHDAA